MYMYKLQVEQPVLGIGTELICARALRCLSASTPSTGHVPHYMEINNIYILKKTTEKVSSSNSLKKNFDYENISGVELIKYLGW